MEKLLFANDSDDIAGHSKYTTTIDKYAADLDSDYLLKEIEKIK